MGCVQSVPDSAGLSHYHTTKNNPTRVTYASMKDLKVVTPCPKLRQQAQKENTRQQEADAQPRREQDAQPRREQERKQEHLIIPSALERGKILSDIEEEEEFTISRSGQRAPDRSTSQEEPHSRYSEPNFGTYYDATKFVLGGQLIDRSPSTERSASYFEIVRHGERGDTVRTVNTYASSDMYGSPSEEDVQPPLLKANKANRPSPAKPPSSVYTPDGPRRPLADWGHDEKAAPAITIQFTHERTRSALRSDHVDSLPPIPSPSAFSPSTRFGAKSRGQTSPARSRPASTKDKKPHPQSRQRKAERQNSFGLGDLPDDAGSSWPQRENLQLPKFGGASYSDDDTNRLQTPVNRLRVPAGGYSDGEMLVSDEEKAPYVDGERNQKRRVYRGRACRSLKPGQRIAHFDAYRTAASLTGSEERKQADALSKEKPKSPSWQSDESDSETEENPLTHNPADGSLEEEASGETSDGSSPARDLDGSPSIRVKVVRHGTGKSGGGHLRKATLGTMSKELSKSLDHSPDDSGGWMSEQQHSLLLNMAAHLAN